MKGVILAGGTGSRLYPLTKVTNKHLLPVGNQPMIYYPVGLILDSETVDCKITDVQIPTEPPDINCGFASVLSAA